MLKEVDKILGKRSALNGAVIDFLHDVDIEIMSPTFQNRRQIDHTPIISKPYTPKSKTLTSLEKLENVVFDKAEEAQSIEKRKERLELLEKSIAEKKTKLDQVNSEEDLAAIQKSLDRDIQIKEKLENSINQKVDALENTV